MPLLVALVLVWLLPETIPVHADSSWQITRYGSRFEIFLIPAAVLLILTVFKFFFDLLERGGATSKGSRLFYSLSIYWRVPLSAPLALSVNSCLFLSWLNRAY